MFENIFKGFSFIKESFSLITKDADLIKPSLYSIFVSITFTIITFIPLFLVQNLFPQEFFYIILFLVILGNYYISYFFTGMTAFLVYDYFKDGDATMSEAWAATKKNAVTIFYLSIVSAIIKLITSFLRGKAQKNRSIAVGFSVMILNLLESVWTVATYFILPAIVIEDRDLKGAIERATSIIKKNLLPIGVGEMAVGLVTGILSFIGFIIAIAIGLMVFGILPSIMGAMIAIFIVLILITLITALSMYITTAYHTCLFLWARDVETSAGAPGSIKPPAPIASALGV